MPFSPITPPHAGQPYTLRSTPVRFQARPSTQNRANPPNEQTGSSGMAQSTSHQPPTPSASGNGQALFSVALGRALPENGEHLDFPTGNGATGSTLVVVEQPDQSSEVQAEGALTVFRPGSVVGSSDHRDDLDEDVILPQTLGNRFLWHLRALGLLGGLALIVPGALMLAEVDEIQSQPAGRARFLSQFLSGIMITGGSVLAGLATVSSVNALHPPLSSRIATTLRSRFTPRPSAATPPEAIELPAAPVQPPV